MQEEDCGVHCIMVGWIDDSKQNMSQAEFHRLYQGSFQPEFDDSRLTEIQLKACQPWKRKSPVFISDIHFNGFTGV
jgi:hypothetical protein